MPTARELIPAFLSAIGLLTFFLIVEVIFRWRQLDPEQSRRLSHMTGTLFGIGIASYFSRSIFITIALLFLAIIIISRRKNYFSHIHKVFRKTFGEELLPVGLLVSYLISNANPDIFIPTFLITGFSDPVNGYVVQKSKSRMFGSAMFLLTAFVILFFFSDIKPLTAILIGLSATIVERLSSYGTDNLTVPAIVAWLLLNFS